MVWEEQKLTRVCGGTVRRGSADTSSWSWVCLRAPSGGWELTAHFFLFLFILHFPPPSSCSILLHSLAYLCFPDHYGNWNNNKCKAPKIVLRWSAKLTSFSPLSSLEPGHFSFPWISSFPLFPSLHVLYSFPPLPPYRRKESYFPPHEAYQFFEIEFIK